MVYFLPFLVTAFLAVADFLPLSLPAGDFSAADLVVTGLAAAAFAFIGAALLAGDLADLAVAALAVAGFAVLAAFLPPNAASQPSA